MKELIYWLLSAIMLAAFLVCCLAYLFLGTDLFRQGLTIAEINAATLDCQRAFLQSYASERNYYGDVVSIKCRGFE